MRKKDKNDRKRNRAIDDETVHRVSTKVRFEESPQVHDTDQEEMGADGNEHEQQEHQEPNNNTPTLSSQDEHTPNSPINRKRKPEEEGEQEQSSETLESFDPTDNEEPFEMDQEVSSILLPDKSSTTVGGACVENIVEHRWVLGQLKMKVMWSTDQTVWEDFRDMKEDHPMMTATYIIDNNVNRLKRNNRSLAWAKKTIRDKNRATRRIARIYNYFLDENEEIFKVRRVQNNKKKRKYKPKVTYKYGIKVPRTIAECEKLDEENRNTFGWTRSDQK